jgi:hypothetical protein
MSVSEKVGKSGRGISPLNVRRDVGVYERIDDFIKRLKSLDDKYMPDAKLLSGSASDKKKYDEKQKVWVSKLRDLVKTERRYLAAEGTAEGKKKPRMRATTYRVRMSLYRRHVVQKMNFINPKFSAKAKAMLDSSLYGPFFLRKVEVLLRSDSYTDLLKKIRDTLEYDVDRLNDAEYAALKDLRKASGHPVLGMLNLTDRLATVVKKKQEKSQTARHTTAVRRISINFYLTWMERILANYKAHDWKNLAIALALATGRRPIELFVTGKFSNPKDNTFLFSGQAKTKLSDSKPYRIPVFYETQVIQDAMKRMRAEMKIPKTATHDEVNRMTAKLLMDRMHAVFEDQVVEFYALRAAYGRLCVQRFYSAKTGTEESFLASILGHSPDDHVTVQHYKTVVFDEEMTLKQAAERWDQIAREEAESSPEAFVTPDLIKRVASHQEKFKRAQAKVFDFILTELKKGNAGVTQSYISRVGGFNSPDLRSGGAKRQYLRV